MGAYPEKGGHNSNACDDGPDDVEIGDQEDGNANSYRDQGKTKEKCEGKVQLSREEAEKLHQPTERSSDTMGRRNGVPVPRSAMDRDRGHDRYRGLIGKRKLSASSSPAGSIEDYPIPTDSGSSVVIWKGEDD